MKIRPNWVLVALACCLVTGWVSAQSLVINEVLASNSSFDYDDFFQFEDWIEVYNAGGILNLEGYHLSDDPDTLDKWMFPSSNPGLTTILPGGHLRIWCDDDEQQGEDHTNFKLSSEGETVFLVEPDGQTIVDSITFGLAQTDISYGRSCDGCDDWVYFNVPTPDAPNSAIDLPVSTLFINECQATNTSTVFDEQFNYSPWVEVFNPNDFQVNLSGYQVELNGTTHVFNNDQPWKTTIEAGEFQIFWMDGLTNLGSNHMGFAPNASGTMRLLGHDESVVDEIEYDHSLAPNISSGRSTDGSPMWTTFNIPTPRVTNALQIITPANVVINEAQSDNFITYSDEASEFEDWVELHNPTTESIDIAGYFLTDRLDRPMKWEVPSTAGDSTIIPPGGFVVLFADEDGSQGWNHMNFKLSSLGEPLALRSPDGFSVADSVFLPSVMQDRSWGRQLDAHSDWVEFFIPTPNASNGANDVTEIQSESFVCFPNPIASGGLIHVNSGAVVYDLQGRLVLTLSQSGIWNVDLPSGTYVVMGMTSAGEKANTLQLLVQ
ncbi:MAG: lamin tail domain-containing protein [Flavobacteriales bacterium]